MGTEARIGLLLGATAMLLAVLVDWVIEELCGEQPAVTSASAIASREVPPAVAPPPGTPLSSPGSPTEVPPSAPSEPPPAEKEEGPGAGA